ncbi:MAG TPA: hypothetical protein VGL64_05955 [Amycolatopsis sp.]|jgi:hypothetical protein
MNDVASAPPPVCGAPAGRTAIWCFLAGRGEVGWVEGVAGREDGGVVGEVGGVPMIVNVPVGPQPPP